ncbi:MAG: lipopolysaccharide kinase InaA family protein, partial [bacterium]|nr:lipopolysaccharide kinase InaA family protein [bacterium]
DEFELGAAGEQLLEVAEQEVDGEAALVGFVDDDRVVVLQLAVAAEGPLLSLSEADFRSLEERCEQLNEQLNELCDELLESEDVDTLEEVGALQERLLAMDVSFSTVDAAPSSPPPPSTPTPSTPSSVVDVDVIVEPPVSPVPAPTTTSTSLYHCGDAPIVVSGSLYDTSSRYGAQQPTSTRLMLRGHFSDKQFGRVTHFPCVIKCAHTEAENEPLLGAVKALRHEHMMYELLQEHNGPTGCVHCYASHPLHRYLVLEDHGRDLRALLHRDLDNAQKLVRSIAEAVQALHARGIMHGDIKPQNILYRLDDLKGHIVKLCDLDCASKVGEECIASTLGTNCFLAPEVY